MKNEHLYQELSLHELKEVVGGWWGHQGQVPSRFKETLPQSNSMSLKNNSVQKFERLTEQRLNAWPDDWTMPW